MNKAEARSVSISFTQGQILQFVGFVFALGVAYAYVQNDIKGAKNDVLDLKKQVRLIRATQEEFRKNQVELKEYITKQIKEALAEFNRQIKEDLSTLEQDINRDRYYGYQADRDFGTVEEKLRVLKEQDKLMFGEVHGIKERLRKLEQNVLSRDKD